MSFYILNTIRLIVMRYELQFGINSFLRIKSFFYKVIENDYLQHYYLLFTVLLLPFTVNAEEVSDIVLPSLLSPPAILQISRRSHPYLLTAFANNPATRPSPSLGF